MTLKTTVAVIGATLWTSVAPAFAQTILETYRAEIAPADIRNSKGAALSDPGAVLAQDRANVHRFGKRQAGDTVDGFFGSRELRAAIPGLLARGTMTRAAARALRAGNGTVLEISVWGQGRNPDYIAVDVAAVQSARPGETPLSAAEMRQHAIAIQSALNARGFDAGPVDGQPGQQTRDAIAAYQDSLGAARTGRLTGTQLAALTEAEAEAAPGPRPSFDCTRAGTAVEKAICASTVLATLDRDLAAAWTAARNADGSEALLAGQRRWLTGRDACGSDAACIEATMRDRIAQLGGSASLDGQVLAAAADGSASQSPAKGSAGAGGFTSRDDLIYIDGRLLWTTVGAGSLTLPQGQDALLRHEAEVARRMTYTGWRVASDDLAGGLAKAPNLGQLRSQFDALPPDAQDKIVRLGLKASSVTDIQRDYCLNLRGGSRFSCATTYLQTEFDRRRFQQAAGKQVARVAQEYSFDLPIPVRVFCPLGPIDSAYDFNTGTVNWASIIGGGCQVESPTVNLGAAVPETMEMDADLVERLARSYRQKDASGRDTYHPLMLAFDGEVSVKRDEAAAANSVGMAKVETILTRVGAVSLLSSASPQEVILTFDAPATDRPTEAVDLSRAEAAYQLIEQAEELDPGRLIANATDDAAPDTGRIVRLAAYPVEQDGTLRLSVENFFLTEEPAQRVAALTGQPLQNVAWTQLIAQDRGVPDTELVLLFSAPFAGVVSEPLGADLAERARRGTNSYMLARMSKPMRMSGVAGPALVAVVSPLGFEVHREGLGGATEIMARPALAKIDVAPQEQVFLPSAWWFAVKGAELKGIDLKDHLAGLFDRANLFAGNTFARLDAIEAAQAKIDAVSAPEDSPVWIAGRASLGPYNLDQQGWPVNGLNIVLPVGDRTETAIAGRVRPDIETSGLFLPMPMEEARAFDESRKRKGQLDFYARIDLSAPRNPQGFNPQARIREILLFPMKGSPSQQMEISPAFDPAEALARIVIEESQAETTTADAPAASPQETALVAKPAVPEDAASEPVRANAPAQAGNDGDWPEVSHIPVERSDWDIIGLHTGMSVSEAHDIITQRGVLAVFERPQDELGADTVRTLRFQRLYVTGDGTEAVTLAAPSPDGPVLGLMRRIQLERGALPFDAIRGTLVEKYGDPHVAGADEGPMSNLFWVTGTPGARQPLCRAYLPARISVRNWQRVAGIGDPGFDLSRQPAAWDWAIREFPIDFAENLSVCGNVVSYTPETTDQRGGAGFTMLFLDAPSIRKIDEALAGVPEADAMDIDF